MPARSLCDRQGCNPSFIQLSKHVSHKAYAAPSPMRDKRGDLSALIVGPCLCNLKLWPVIGLAHLLLYIWWVHDNIVHSHSHCPFARLPTTSRSMPSSAITYLPIPRQIEPGDLTSQLAKGQGTVRAQNIQLGGDCLVPAACAPHAACCFHSENSALQVSSARQRQRGSILIMHRVQAFFEQAS